MRPSCLFSILSFAVLAPSVARANDGSAVPRTVTVTYAGEIPVAPDVGPYISMQVAPAPKERERLNSVDFDPVGLVSGRYAISAARRMSEHIAIRVDGQVIDGSNPIVTVHTWRTGITAPIYLDRAFHGPFIEPGVFVARRLSAFGLTQETDAMASVYAAYDHAAGPQVFVGWQWLFRSGLTIAGAIGASQNWAGNDVPVGVLGVAVGGPSAPWWIRPATESYVRVGYAF